MDEGYNCYEAAIPDGKIKTRAIAQAKRAMKNLGVKTARLAVYSVRTYRLLNVFRVELD